MEDLCAFFCTLDVPNQETQTKPAQIISYVIRVFQLTFLFKKDVKVYFTISHLHLLAR